MSEGSKRTQFRPGVSGNHGGKPKGSVVAARRLKIMCQKHADEAIETILAVMRNPEEAGRTRVYAAELLLQRGFGKPDVDKSDDVGERDSALTTEQSDRVLDLLHRGALRSH